MWLLAVIVVVLVGYSAMVQYFEHKENMEAIKNGTSLERINNKEW